MVSLARQRFYLWIPNIFGFKGGIQVYSAFFLEALQSLYPDKDYHVFLKHDKTQLPDFSFLPHTNFHFTGHIPLPLRTPIFATQLLTSGLRHPPNLIISTHLNFTPVAYWLKKLTGTPYWTVAHGVDAWNIQNSTIQKALHHADLILAVSHYTRNRLLNEQNLKPEKVVVLPNTFDAQKFNIGPKPEYLLARYQLNSNQPIILTVARLDQTEQYKGYDKILEALPKIKEKLPNIHYILVGKGDDTARVQELIKSLNLQADVTLTGFIPDSELADHYNLCDLFAMPSKGEGFGIVYLEALACGKPIVGGNQDGAIDAICQGKLGLLVDPDNINQMADLFIKTLQRTCEHPLIYKPLELRSQVIEKFGFDSFKNQLFKYLEELEN